MTADGLILLGVGASFGQIVALNSIDMEIPNKGVIAFVGHNGSGKSTLLDILSGFLRPSRGNILDGALKDTIHRSDLIARVARLHQRLVVPPTLQAGRFLTVVSRRHSLLSLLSPVSSSTCSYSRDASNDLLRAANLVGSMDVPLGKLSYGQQRVLSLEAVLATTKPFVALDEPLAGLHPTVRDSVLRRVQEEGRARCIIIAEHDLAGALSIADRVVVFRLGAIVADVPSAGITAENLVMRL